VWDFHKGTVLQTHDLGAAVTAMEMHRDSDLVAVATDSLRLVVLDVDTGKLVRYFDGHTNRITDLVRPATARCCQNSGMSA